MTHEQFRELLPLYVVGALDGEELLEFERYVAGGRERCAPEVAEFQVIADQLVYAAPAAQPSPGVFGRVLAGISEAAPAGAPVPVRQQPFAWGALFFGWIPWTATAVVATVLVITTGQLRQMTQQSTRISELSSNVAVQANQFKEETDQLRVTNASLRQEVDALKTANAKLDAEKTDLMRAATELRQQISKQNELVASLQQNVGEQGKMLDVVMDPSIRVAQMGDPKQQTKAAAKVYWHDVKRTGVLVASNLPPVLKGESNCLELWAFCGKEAPVPAGLFWTDSAGHGVLEIKLAREMACVDKFAVTVEPSSGVPAPTGPMILLGP